MSEKDGARSLGWFWLTLAQKKALEFSNNPTKDFLECEACKKEKIRVNRIHVGAASAEYMIDPSAYADVLTHAEMKRLGTIKHRYFKLFSVAIPDGDDTDIDVELKKHIVGRLPGGSIHEGKCPSCHCKEVVGPLSFENQALVRCMDPTCLRVYCVGCADQHIHKTQDCPVIKQKLAMAKREEGGKFDPVMGRSCPYPGCPARGIQHFRNDGYADSSLLLT